MLDIDFKLSQYFPNLIMNGSKKTLSWEFCFDRAPRSLKSFPLNRQRIYITPQSHTLSWWYLVLLPWISPINHIYCSVQFNLITVVWNPNSMNTKYNIIRIHSLHKKINNIWYCCTITFQIWKAVWKAAGCISFQCF